MNIFSEMHQNYLDPDRHDLPQDDDTNDPKAIRCLEELLAARGFDEKSIEDVSRNCYKYTDCGASCQAMMMDSGVRLGSIVEGVDGDGISFDLPYPFTMDEFYGTLDEVEAQASRIWMETHGCEDCDTWDEETGYKPVHPNCPTCEGKGVVI